LIELDKENVCVFCRDIQNGLSIERLQKTKLCTEIIMLVRHSSLPDKSLQPIDPVAGGFFSIVICIFSIDCLNLTRLVKYKDVEFDGYEGFHAAWQLGQHK
jgi:hypothetical protein